MIWLSRALDLLKLFVFADAIFSWVLRPEQFPRSVTKPLLDPFYEPLRKLLAPITGPLDLTPLIALGLIFALQRALVPPKQSDED